MPKNYSEITPYIEKLANIGLDANGIKPEMYTEYNVKRGLRDLQGKGVLTGLTEISEVNSRRVHPDGTEELIPGELFYRGIQVSDFVDGFTAEGRFGFEECIYLLLFGHLPSLDELTNFKELLGSYRSLPPSFVRDMILKASSPDMMNAMARCVLALYSYDEKPDDISLPNVLRQCLQLIAEFPLIAVYGYQSYSHYHKGQSLFIHPPKPELSTAENILHLLRPNSEYTETEAKTLDLALILHAEHGGGNNSTFTTHVVTSSGTDTYSAIAASLGSLKGPRHGGANIKVVQMFDDIKANVDYRDEGALKDHLVKLLDKQAFDRSGLIYGMGHAVYSLSDPRAEILHKYAQKLSAEKGLEEDFALYETVARLAPEIIAEKRRMYKGVSANVDFYSGMVYRMLGLPEELFTPIFAVSRIAGWSAHRLEEIQNAGKIIRPAYTNVKKEIGYLPIGER